MLKKFPAFFIILFLSIPGSSQNQTPALAKAMQQFLQDQTMQHAVSSLYVTNSKTGDVVYALNEQAGLAPGSTQKIFTSIAAFDILGKGYHFGTNLGYTGEIENGILKGDIIIHGLFDPSLGSDRFPNTNPSKIFDRFLSSIKAAGIKKIQGEIIAEPAPSEIPAAWIWEDIGNYFGAAASALNWRENEYQIHLRSGEKIGSPVEIISVNNDTAFPISFINELTTAAKGTGDQTNIYLPLNSDQYLIRGTIPAGENNFHVSGAMTDPAAYFLYDFKNYLKDKLTLVETPDDDNKSGAANINFHLLYKNLSPAFDSLNYFFMQQSINLYGEAFLKKMALTKTSKGNTAEGINVLQKYWNEKGIDPAALHIFDGSGLSPQNRVTGYGLVKALNYAKTQAWFPEFYKAIPEHNNIKMKSGTIHGVKAYAGYIKSQNGQEYTFAFIVNNYDGSHSQLVQKMYAVLNTLK